MIPPRIREGITEYARTGLPQGRFLDACLENDLFTAVCAADKDSLAAIREVALLIDQVVPKHIRGSASNVRAWRESARRAKAQAV